MVAIIDDKKIIMGADSCGSNDDDDSFIVAKNTKIFQKGDFLIGCAHSFRLINVVEHFFVPPKLDGDLKKYMTTQFVMSIQKILEKHKIDPVFHLSMLIGIHDTIFEIQSDYSVLLMPAYGASIGSGALVARGSLHTTWNSPLSGSQRVLKALEAAEANVASVRGPFDFLEV